MSYAVDVYLPDVAAPTARVRGVVERLGLPVRENDAFHWTVHVDAGVDLALDQHVRSCAPAGVRWRLSVGTSNDRSRAAWAVQRVVPYLFLSLVDGCSFHDCQRHDEGLVVDPLLYLASMVQTQQDLPDVTRARLTGAGLLGRGLDARAMAAWTGNATFLTGYAMDLRREGDLTGAREWLGFAAAAGDPHAMVELAFALEEKGAVAAALTWLERAVAAGDVTALAARAVFAEIHQPAEARAWYERAAAAGDQTAAEWLATGA